MPKAPRRSRSFKSKPLVNWLPVIDMMLRQGHLTLTNLVTLYKTSKAVQALFTDFWMLLEIRASRYRSVFVPDITTWCAFFRSFKTRVAFIEHGSMFSKFEPEICVIVPTLIIHGHVELAGDIATRFGWFSSTVENAILLNGSQSVYDRCMQRFAELHPNWLEDRKDENYPEPPLFSLDLARKTSLWDWFEWENDVNDDSLMSFIADIGELRSTVGLDFMLSSLNEITFQRNSKSPKTLQAQIVKSAHNIEVKVIKNLRKTYASWNDPKAQQFVREFITPLEEKVYQFHYFF
jgi:hypothetical protein